MRMQDVSSAQKETGIEVTVKTSFAIIRAVTCRMVSSRTKSHNIH